MSKTVMTLHLPEPKIRKRAVRAVQKHRDKSRYTRKRKHKAADTPAAFALIDAYTPMNYKLPYNGRKGQ